MWSALQKKTAEQDIGGGEGGISHATEEEEDINNIAAPNNNKENNILAIRSPILSTLTNNNNIRQFETDILQRQAEYSGRISDLEGRLASFHSKLAVESVEREREVARTMGVSSPLIRIIIWVIIVCVLYLLIWGCAFSK